jgi:hypothetical protein
MHTYMQPHTKLILFLEVQLHANHRQGIPPKLDEDVDGRSRLVDEHISTVVDDWLMQKLDGNCQN